MLIGDGGRDTDRAVATTLGYALSLGITSLLITGLLFAGGTFVEDQRDRAVRAELEVTGQQVAGAIGSADRLAGGLEDGGSVTVRRSLPERAAGSGYRFEVDRVGHRDVYELTLQSFDPDISVAVRTYSEAAVYAPDAVDGGQIVVQANDALTPKLFVTEPDAEPAFVEENGEVVLEAEGPTGTLAGSSDEADHYWETFRDADASGGWAVTTRPNVSSGVGSPGNPGDATTGPALTYDVEFESSGTYYVFVRMRAPSGDSDSVHVALDDDTPVTYGGLGLGDEAVSGSWRWSQYVADDVADGPVTVSPDSAGVHTLRLYMREDGTQVDKIILRRVNDDPSGTGPSAF